ncbi:FMN-binding negative transcriptional regulator [Bradyrhizobium sp. CCBAU 53380]|uniref:FMN-binding negative transcriptional regulator n=1 Tax=Bradyrhizobium sp. CCBAU 53380 TaxID=1325117 RepID=UPI00230352C9|nr:FMN-binding negative transcriptional regulator [Bradyrhizobium sp. CCBAU 53380]MDA9426187.1 transcriptional regulator [Bradyrhizobium sp. CCBAU 53380]
MYIPLHFRDDDIENIRATIRCARLANLVTATSDGPLATPLPLFLDESEGKHGALYGHLAKGNPQWCTAPIGEALAIFTGAEAYVTPSWYPSKRQAEQVVPTWNYIAVHAQGPIEFFEDCTRLLAIVTRLTNIHEASRATPWAVSDAPAGFIAAQLREIVGVRIPITRIEGKRKMSQNRPVPDRIGVATGLAASKLARDQEVASLILAED